MTAATEWLSLWVIFKNPSDYPDKFVVREQRVFRGHVHICNEALVCQTLDAARGLLPDGLVNIGRKDADDPVIYEVWV